MIVKRNLFEIKDNHHTVVTIGTFDGVHVGHRKIIRKLVANAKANNLRSTILTFFPHPRMVLQQASDLKLLNTLDEKKEILAATGLEQLIIHPFTKEFSRMTAEEYVKDVLVGALQAKKVIIGYDHRFGRNRTATIEDLKVYGERYGFDVEQISVEEVDEVSVSSTKIRKALAVGDIETANQYLGYSYMLSGIITRGKGLGRQLEFPTANLHIEEPYKLVPENGVYVVKSRLGDREVFGMMNIGYNPTVDGKQKSIEVHFFDFDEDLYEKPVRVSLLHRLRNETRFDSLDELKQQLRKDKERSLAYIAQYYA
ncbi:bifunctional riboflavin kinase/FAD synthetase [Robertkochia marina]|uniref:Riboflavin biosynthesis protein n=1 Tax=Robertkochia marina TaxID=1227945 RepID=A0A4S3M397_9FLAO|nr:bifunctional riboflavin kinase/FAD synthetase [Robertkochia marina]THD69632.1 bifunctional riboflavin kinase/FAD synthetase [Robertkochia marina]TRZ47023.1 bifunctional riboflavin kinase/FAD synthetase [Robertkochia marina]